MALRLGDWVYRDEPGSGGGDEMVGGTSVGELGSPERFSGMGSVSPSVTVEAGVEVSGSRYVWDRSLRPRCVPFVTSIVPEAKVGMMSRSL